MLCVLNRGNLMGAMGMNAHIFYGEKWLLSLKFWLLVYSDNIYRTHTVSHNYVQVNLQLVLYEVLLLEFSPHPHPCH